MGAQFVHLGHYSGRNQRDNLRAGFANADQVGAVFGPLGGATTGIGQCPEFPLHQIFQSGDWKAHAEEFALDCAGRKRAIAGVDGAWLSY